MLWQASAVLLRLVFCSASFAINVSSTCFHWENYLLSSTRTLVVHQVLCLLAILMAAITDLVCLFDASQDIVALVAANLPRLFF